MIGPVQAPTIQPANLISPAGQTASGTAFASVLEAAVQRVEASHGDAAASIQSFLSGEGEELHTTALAVQKSELELELFLQVRNKVVQAYQEIMRTQV